MSCKSSDQRDQDVGLSWQRRELADRAHSFQFTDDKNRGTQAESNVLEKQSLVVNIPPTVSC